MSIDGCRQGRRPAHDALRSSIVPKSHEWKDRISVGMAGIDVHGYHIRKSLMRALSDTISLGMVAGDRLMDNVTCVKNVVH